MTANRSLFAVLFILLAASLLAGCSASGRPRLIAAFPLGEPQKPPTLPIYPEPPTQFVYNAHLEIEVWNPSRAASKAEELAYKHGGYMVSSHTRFQDRQEHPVLVLAVPVYSFQALFSDLQGLGKVVDERVWGQWQSYGPGGAPNYSQITVELSGQRFTLPSISLGGWNPGRTFASALRVSAAIFAFMVDSMIWLLVVAAPFALLALGLRALYLRMRKKS